MWIANDTRKDWRNDRVRVRPPELRDPCRSIARWAWASREVSIKSTASRSNGDRMTVQYPSR